MHLFYLSDYSIFQHNFFKRTTDEATNTSKSANASPANIDPQLHSSIPPPISSASAAASKGMTVIFIASRQA